MRKFLKISGFVLGGIILLLGLFIVLLQTPWGQNQVRDYTVSYLQTKLGVPVSIQEIGYQLPNHIQIQGLYLPDKQGDTLCYLNNFQLDWTVWGLFEKKIIINQIAIDGISGLLSRKAADTTFNFQFIVDSFAGNSAPEPEPKKKNSGFAFDVHKLVIDHLRFRLEDSAGGNFLFVKMSHLLTHPTLVDLENSRYALNSFEMSGVKSNLILGKSFLPLTPEDTSAGADFHLTVERFKLEDMNFDMLSQDDSMFLSSGFGSFNGNLKDFDLRKEKIIAGDLIMEDGFTQIALGRTKPTIPELADTLANNWQISANELILNRMSYVMDDPTQPKLKQGVDYSHMNVSGLFLSAADAFYSEDSTSAEIKHLVFREKSGLNVMELRALATYTQQKAVLKNFYLQTPNSLLKDYLAIYYPSIESLGTALDKSRVDIRLKDSRVGMQDVLLFTPPGQQKMLLPYKNQSFKLVATADGYVNKLKLKQLYLSGLKNTTIDLSGSLDGLPNMGKMGYDLDIKELYTVKQDYYSFLPDDLKSQYVFPNWIKATGKIKGNMNDYYPNLVVSTDEGGLKVDGYLKTSPGKGKETYALKINTTNLDLGRILKRDTLVRKLSGNIMIAGTGFDPKTMDTKFGLDFPQIFINGRNYQDIHLAGEIKHQMLSFNGNSSAPGLNFSVFGVSNLQNKYPSLHLDLDLRNADLFALGLTTDTVSVSGKILADFTSLNPDYPDGVFQWHQPVIHFNEKNITPDSFYLASHPDGLGNQQITLNLADILHGNLSGNIPLTKLGDAVEAHINRHYHISDSISNPDETPYRLQADGYLSYQPALKQFYPDLLPFDSIPFNSLMDPDTFGFALDSRNLRYGSNKMDSLSIHVEENPQKLQYWAALKMIQTPAAALWYPFVGGSIRNDSIYVVANISDSLKKRQFTLGGAYFQKPEENDSLSYFRLFKGLRFNYDIWSVNPENQIVIGKDGFYIHGLNIQHDTQSISLNSDTTSLKSPLNIEIKNFSLANLSKLFSRDSIIAEGNLNSSGKIDLSNRNLPKINLSLFVNGLKAFGTPMGDLSARVQNQDMNTLNAFLSLEGSGNQLQVYGDYYLQPSNKNDFNLTADLKNLRLKTLEPFAFGGIKNSSGSIAGNLAITGTTASPNINGIIYTKKLKTNVSLLNEDFSVPSDTITIANKRINFNQFHIYDDQGQPGILNGIVFTPNYKRFFLNLNFNAQKWRVMHSTKRDNPDYYGNLVLSTDLNLKGAATAPSIDGNVVVHDSTNLTYAYDNSAQMLASEGIVQFVDSRDTALATNNASDVDTLAGPRRRFHISPTAQVNVNVAVDDKATFTVLVDPSTGDQLQIRGSAALNASMDPSGIIGLTGVYRVDDGYYLLNYQLLKRKFRIKDGSTVTLSGDPLDAVADIQAVYTTDIAPYDLVEQVASSDQLVLYKQTMPFDIILNIKGKVMQPDISFDIALSQSKLSFTNNSDVTNLVQAKLNEIRNDPSELNKQVFAALVLNNFLSNDPFSSVSGFDVGAAAKRSASRLLSDQLNQLAGNLISGVQLNFNLNTNEDYSTGTKIDQTDLSVEASKSLFNDRLKVTVGNDFQLEGEVAPRQQSSLIPGNLSISYLLTKDGKYRANAYRTNQLQDIVNGYVVETGIKFNATLSFNKLKYLFIDPKKYWAKIRAQRAAQNAENPEKPKQTPEESTKPQERPKEDQ